MASSWNFVTLYYIVLSFLEGVMADMCQDLCNRMLGPSGCPKGSWCKNNYDCHAIFWTDASQMAICVFDGTSGRCDNRYPVLCSEATRRLTSLLGPISQQTTTLTTATTTTTTTTTTTRAATTTTTTRSTTTGETTSSTTTSSSTITGMATTATIAVPNGGIVNAFQPIELSMHYNPFERDSRPRIKVSFLAHSQDIGFSLLLDTGASVSHLVQATGTAEEAARLEHAPPSYLPEDGIDSSEEPVARPAKWEEGYLNIGLVSKTGEGRDLRPGPDGRTRAIRATERIKEIAQLFSGSTSFIFEMNMYLTTGMENRFTGVGLLGAGVRSDFARAVGVFAFMGPLVDYAGYAPTSAGRLFLGQRDVSVLNKHCVRGSNIVFFPLIPEMSAFHWTVSGSTELDSSTNRIVEPENFMVDTGAGGVFVSRSIIDAVSSELEASGAVLVSDVPGRLKKYSNCRIESLPNIIVRLGIGPQVVSVTVTPREYIRRPDIPLSTFCFLDLSEGMVRGRVRVVGMKVLSKLMTVFDSENNRIGFCNTRRP